MKYAIIKFDGRQFYVNEGMFFTITRIPKPEKTLFLINKILILKTVDVLYIGKPYITCSSIFLVGEIMEHIYRSKLIIFKMRSKKKYRHHLGYRIKITKILMKNIRV
jgi:large subunit ribosomal protein L21